MTNRSSEPVRAALLGTGGWSKVLAASAYGSRLRLVCCWSRTPERLHAFAVTTGIAPAADLESIWCDPSIEAVVLAVPNPLHCSLAMLASSHHKHVFVEKPIAHSLDGGLAMAELESEFGIRLVVGHCARMLFGNRFIARAVHDGDLGRVTCLEAKFSNDRGLKLTSEDWRWYDSRAPGGPLSQIAIHQFDTLRAIGGDLASVSAQSARLSPSGAEVHDQWVLGVRFVDGKLGSIVTSWTSPGAYSVRATGEAASLSYEIDQALWSTPERLHEHAVLERQERGQGLGARTRVAVPPGNMVRDELELFADCVRHDRPCELSAENGCHALAAVDAALASVRRRGEAVSLREIMDAARVRLNLGRAQFAAPI